MDYIGDISIWFVVKIGYLFALFLYIVFSFVIVRQVNIMNKTLDVGYETLLEFIAFAHFLFAIGTFFLALIIL